MFLQLDGDTELARAVELMMAGAKRNYILIIKVDKLFSFLYLGVFYKRNTKHVQKEIENMYRVSIEL